MSSRVVAGLLLTISWILPLSASASATAIAVFPLESTEDLASAAADLTALVEVELGLRDDVRLVDRAALAKVLGEQAIGLSGTVDASTASRVGQLTGVEVLVGGRLLRTGDAQLAVLRLVSTGTGRILPVRVRFTDEEGIETAAARLAEAMTAALAEAPASFRGVEAAGGETLEALAATLGDAARPTVIVVVPEEHLARRVPDPAGETELRRALATLGFQVVTPESSHDLAIRGEAFSEGALALGGLVSCRARVEIRVEDREGRIVFSGAATATAVDIAEAVAGKTALERAARRLLPDLVPALVAPIAP